MVNLSSKLWMLKYSNPYREMTDIKYSEKNLTPTGELTLTLDQDELLFSVSMEYCIPQVWTASLLLTYYPCPSLIASSSLVLSLATQRYYSGVRSTIKFKLLVAQSVFSNPHQISSYNLTLRHQRPRLKHNWWLRLTRTRPMSSSRILSPWIN